MFLVLLSIASWVVSSISFKGFFRPIYLKNASHIIFFHCWFDITFKNSYFLEPTFDVLERQKMYTHISTLVMILKIMVWLLSLSNFRISLSIMTRSAFRCYTKVWSTQKHIHFNVQLIMNNFMHSSECNVKFLVVQEYHR